ATQGVEEIYYYDRMNSTLRWLSAPAGLDPDNDSSYELSISSDGAWVAFSSNKSNLVPNDTNGVRDIFLWSRASEDLERVNLSYAGNDANFSSYHPAVSDDGRYVAFRSFATNLIPSQVENYSNDVFRRDRHTGTTERVNLPYNGEELYGSNSGEPVISADGRFIAFRSDMSNLVSGDTNGIHDVFVRDMQGSVTRISEDSTSSEANAGSFGPAINASGDVTVFYSDAQNLDLIRDDTNGARDVFSQGVKPTAPPEPTATPTETATATPTDTPVPTETDTPVPTETDTPVPTETDTPDPTETDTPDPTETDTPVPTETDTPVPTETDTPVPTETDTPVPTETDTPEPTETDTPEPTETDTPVPTETETPEPSPTEPTWTLDSFNLTSDCKLNETTGQMRITNDSGEAQPFTLLKYNSEFKISDIAPIGESLWEVPFADSGDTFILQIAGYGYVKAIGDNPLCDPEPTDTVEPTETTEPTETPEPTDTPTPEPTDPPIAVTWELDFETDAYGAVLPAGTIIDDEWSSFGIHIATNKPDEHPAMIFDSGAPTGYDRDLGTPNEDFNGPGLGSGGGLGEPGENNAALGNILILSEDGDPADPDDYYAGGNLIFEFDDPVNIAAVQMVDIDVNEGNSRVVAYSASGEELGTFAILPLGNNSVQWVELDVTQVTRLTVYLQSSGALAAISFYGEEPTAVEPEPTPNPTPEPSDPPVIELQDELTLDEGESFKIEGKVSDPDSSTWTASVDFGDGGESHSIEITDGTFSIAGVYGDNGDYTLEVLVSDETGAEGFATVQVSVENVDPEISTTTLHTLESCQAADLESSGGSSKVACEVGDWMVAKMGETTTFTFDLADVGSDDLTFIWDDGSDVTYFNNETEPDPLQSPLGQYPYSVTHFANVTFDKPGVKHIKVRLQDDDGGEDTIEMKVLVRNNQSCQASLGDWISYFMKKNKDAGLEGELRAHLSILSGFVSSAFGDMDAEAINALEEFILKDMDQSAQARAELLTAWLNFVNGPLDWDDVIKDADGKQDLTYAETLHRILLLLQDDSPSQQQLQKAIELARAINFSNKGGGSCSR
ncbi:MAG: PKD domain-containing protein, partial [Anaerolineales bacterium]